MTLAWEQREFSELGDLSRGKSRHRPRNDKLLYGGDYPFIQTGDVAKAELFLNSFSQTYSDFGLQQSKLWNEGTLVITIAANIADSAILAIKAAFPDSIIGFEAKDCDVVFVKFSLDKISELLRSKVETSSQANLNHEKLSKIKFTVPKKEEQSAIGTFFRTLDTLIANQKRKLDGMKQLKKAYLQQMFPQAGETTPKVRFSGFNAPWEMRRFSDILKVNSGKDYKHLNAGSIPVFGTGGYMLSIDESLSSVDAVGIGRKGTIDKPQLLKAPFWTVDTLFFIIPKQENDLLFIFTLAQHIEWAKMDESTGVPSLSKNNIENLSMCIPSYNEQIAIGVFFQAIDKNITNQQTQLDSLIQLKSAYLQKMFV